jgi:hypothetical protein
MRVGEHVERKMENRNNTPVYPSRIPDSLHGNPDFLSCCSDASGDVSLLSFDPGGRWFIMIAVSRLLFPSTNFARSWSTNVCITVGSKVAPESTSWALKFVLAFDDDGVPSGSSASRRR